MSSPVPRWWSNPAARRWRTAPAPSEVLPFHRGLPGYRPTPLVEVPELAAELQVGEVLVKDESSRLGLPAFKILGASYAVSRALSARLGVSDAALGLDELRARLAARGVPRLLAATDGNHGRAVAHLGRLLGLPARIFVQSLLTAAAKQAIASEGAVVSEVDLPYDDVVALAAEVALDEGDAALLVQDTSWPGYEQVPQWIVDGYSTMFVELEAQLDDRAAPPADLLVVPMGVGSLAQAAVRHARSSGRPPPVVLGVEPECAPGVLASLGAGAVTAAGTGQTVMAGLNCGTPSEIAWPTLRAGLDAALTVSDDDTVRAVRDLQRLGVDAGPCGAATLAAVRQLVSDPARRSATGLDGSAVVVLLSTEGRSANPLPG